MMSTQTLSEDSIQAVLKTLIPPYLGIDLWTAATVKTLNIQEDEVILNFTFGFPLSTEARNAIKVRIEASLSSLLKGKKLKLNINWKVNQHLAQKQLKPVNGVKNIIAIASGKGGVGKSTTAINVALAMAKEGARVGILDADIYGPSQPLFLGIYEKPKVGEDKRLIPILRYGLQTMSMGYLVEEEAPMVWRGPMVSSALQQLLYETAWDNVDYLIVDLPPGTGDIHLTLAQKIPVSGAVIITTPQEAALIDAKKALAMFRKLDIFVLGVIENMSDHICSHCGHIEAIFGKGGGHKIAEQFGVPLLGELPLDRQIQWQVDQGQPSVVFEPEGKVAKLYQEIARRMMAQLSLRPRDYSAAFANMVVS